jgi:hypothetical protein
MRKTKFTKNEYNELKLLISKKALSDRDEQKKIRNRIRRIGFHFSDFSSKKRYDVSDLEELVKSGQIQIHGEVKITSSKKIRKSAVQKLTSNSVKNLSDPFSNARFCDFGKLDAAILNQTGLYCIRLRDNVKLSVRYNCILDKRGNKIIYIGKAQGQSLKERLSQEVFHTSPGTFFRSIGVVIGFTPIPGHLKGKSNQKNYKFSKSDTKAITDWLIENTEFAVHPVVNKDFSIEKDLIKKYCPLLNDTHNPLTLAELKTDRKKCREIALGK